MGLGLGLGGRFDGLWKAEEAALLKRGNVAEAGVDGGGNDANVHLHEGDRGTAARVGVNGRDGVAVRINKVARLNVGDTVEFFANGCDHKIGFLFGLDGRGGDVVCDGAKDGARTEGIDEGHELGQ